MRTCSKCSTDKAFDCFPSSKGKYKPICKACEKLIHAAWYVKNRDSVRKKSSSYQKKTRKLRTAYTRKWRLKNIYCISEEAYQALLKHQNGCCKICGKSRIELDKELCVDHCNVTSKVRGLLCHACNVGIGYLRHDIENLTRAISYLQEATNESDIC